MLKVLTLGAVIVAMTASMASAQIYGAPTAQTQAINPYGMPATPRSQSSFGSQPYGGTTMGSPGDHMVSGYERSNGTYVEPYHATNPNNTRSDNYSTRGNVNPYTGVAGTKSPYDPN